MIPVTELDPRIRDRVACYQLWQQALILWQDARDAWESVADTQPHDWTSPLWNAERATRHTVHMTWNAWNAARMGGIPIPSLPKLHHTMIEQEA